MVELVENILKKYGTPVVLKRGDETWDLQIFFQPVRSKSWQYLEGEYSPLGEVPRGQYVYIGPVSPAAEAGDTVTVGKKSYWLRHSELIWAGDEPVYCWGICVEKGGEDTWGQS